MKKKYVEFYFPGLSVAGSCEKEVSERNPELVTPPQYAFAFRFFEKTQDGQKVNFSGYYYLGKEYTIEDYLKKIINPENMGKCTRVVKLITGGFRPLKDDDIVLTA